jgi:hypothetical protein
MTNEEWFKLPLKLRQRWWRETEYGKTIPSRELIEEISEWIEKQKCKS